MAFGDALWWRVTAHKVTSIPTRSSDLAAAAVIHGHGMAGFCGEGAP